MCAVPSVSEAIHASNGVGGCCLGNIRLGGSHELPPVVDGVRMSEYHRGNGATAHILYQAIVEKLIWGEEGRCNQSKCSLKSAHEKLKAQKASQ